MSSTDEDEDHEDIEVPATELFDISGVKFDMKQNTRRRTICLILEGPEDSDWNLFRFYLALDWYVRKMEDEIGVMNEPLDEQ
jgi:hypothetical protein